VAKQLPEQAMRYDMPDAVYIEVESSAALAFSRVE
jgi:hypothetical protein